MTDYRITVAPGKEADFEEIWPEWSAADFSAEVSHSGPEQREAIIRPGLGSLPPRENMPDTGLFTFEALPK